VKIGSSMSVRLLLPDFPANGTNTFLLDAAEQLVLPARGMLIVIDGCKRCRNSG
jgi:hypothetical protein